MSSETKYLAGNLNSNKLGFYITHCLIICLPGCLYFLTTLLLLVDTMDNADFSLVLVAHLIQSIAPESQKYCIYSSLSQVVEIS